MKTSPPHYDLPSQVSRSQSEPRDAAAPPGAETFEAPGDSPSDGLTPARMLQAAAGVAALVVVLAAMWRLSQINYLLFHALVETISVVVAWGIFLVAWNTRRFLNHGFYLFLGLAFLAAGAIDLLHTLAYKGMNVFPKATANLPTQLWIAARYLQAVSFLMAPLFLTRRVNAHGLLAVFAAVTTALLALVFGERFPDCFVEGEGGGLTPFKVYSEYVISALLIGAIVFVYLRRRHLDSRIRMLVIGAVVASVGSELAFTFYVRVHGISNMVGHIFKIVAFVLFYKALLETGLRRPFRFLWQNLAASEEKFRTLFETMTEGFALHEIITDERRRPRDYVFLDVNPAFERLTGLKRGDLVGRRVLDVLPGTESYWIDTFGEVALTGKPARLENYSVELDHWYDVYAYRTAPRRFAVVFSDVTDRKRAEQALRESEERYRELVQNANSAIIRWKRDGTITFFNEYAQSFFGYKEDEILGRSAGLLLPDVESTGRDLSSLKADIVERPDHYVHNVNENVREDGRRVWMAWTNKPILDADGEVAEILAVGVDITERKKAEEKVQELNRELEQRVEQRTADLAASERNLRRLAAQLATAQDQEQQRIAEGLHDDVAQLLAACGLKLSLAARSREEDKRQKFYDEAAALVKESNRKVRLMSFELGSATLYRLGLYDAVIELADSMEERYGIRFEVRIDGERAPLDESMSIVLYKAVRELMFNVAKHAGVKEASVAMRREVDDLWIAVEDSGKGIEDVEVVQESTIGDGLGLFGVRQRLSDLGGSMWIESHPGVRTRVTLWAPLKRDEK